MTVEKPNKKPLNAQFPSRFPLKAVGKSDTNFPEQVFKIVKSHIPYVQSDDMVTRPSGGGKYTAVTVTFLAESREQVEAIYTELNTLDSVLMLL